MKLKLLLSVWMLLLATASLSAQNAIDKAVEEYSSIGRSSFTSAVERDPQTRKVQKVVKVLEPTDMTIGKLRKAFLNEQDSGQFNIVTNDDEETMMLTVENAKEVRIYQLIYKGQRASFRNGKLTIIIKYK